jgi:hypothetical protein
VFSWTLYAAIPINCGLIVYTFDAVNFLSSQGKIWTLVGLGGLMVFSMSQLELIYPSLPQKTAIQLERQNVVYRRVVLGQEPEERGGRLDFELHESMLGTSVERAKKMHLLNTLSELLKGPAGMVGGGNHQQQQHGHGHSQQRSHHKPAVANPKEAGMTIKAVAKSHPTLMMTQSV